MMERAVVFPFSETTLPIIRHFNALQGCYSLQKVMALNGSGLTGKDAAFVCNQPVVGITVENDVEKASSDWDTLVVDCANIDNKIDASMDVEGLFRTYLEANKRILFIYDATLPERHYKALMDDYPNQISCLDAAAVDGSSFDSAKWSTLPVPILLVGGLVKTSDTLEIVLSLKEQFDNNHRKVSCITSSNLGALFGLHSYHHIFNNSYLSEEDKILQLNRFARDIVYLERPELVIVEAPDAVMKFSTITPNGFGILTYMLTQAIDINLFVCSMPADIVNKYFIDYLSCGIFSKYGFNISAVHASNIVVDSMAALQDQALSCLHIHMEKMLDVLKNMPKDNSIYTFNLFLQGAKELYGLVSKQLEQGV